jgi:hypothetical protein
VDLQRLQVLEWVDLAQGAGVDEAHVNVACLGPVGGLVEEGVLSMSNRPLEGAFDDIVINSGYSGRT